MTDDGIDLRNRTIVMSGGSRGIGLAIALRAAKEGANVALLAKTGAPDERLNGTVHTAVEQIEAAGGSALGVVGDVRNDEDVARTARLAEERFGGIDIVINNASALVPAATADLSAKQYDLMQDINTRGTFMLTRACLPALQKSDAAKVLTLSPPLNLDSQDWLSRFPGYLLSKYGMSLLTLAFAAEFRQWDISVTSLWPRTTIATDAVGNLLGGSEALRRSRTPEIMADAAYDILSRRGDAYTGQLIVDEDVLRARGVSDFSRYAVDGVGNDLTEDFFLDPLPSGTVTA